jgi:uncharacterized membrane protein YkvA (DUF1232 family)
VQGEEGAVLKENMDFYQLLRRRVRAWAATGRGRENSWVSIILLAPDVFHLLCKLMARREVPAADKVKLAAVIAYFISPLDLLPEGIIGPFGYADDIALAAWVICAMLNHVDNRVIAEEWAGEGNVIAILKGITLKTEDMLGKKLWGRVKGRLPGS